MNSFFKIEFQPIMFAFDDCVFYHQTKTPIGFWWRWGLNSRFFIQPSKTLPFKQTETHFNKFILFESILLNQAHQIEILHKTFPMTCYLDHF